VGVMYYDQELFDQYGVPYPEIGWTWHDFLNAALALRDFKADVFGYGMNRPSLGDYLFFVYPHGGRLVDDLQNSTRPTFDDPLTVEALEWYADLMYEHNVAPTPEQSRTLFCCSSEVAPIGAIDIGIVNGKVGMWMGRFSERGGMRYFSGVKWRRRWGMVTVPRDARSATLAWGEGLFISSQAQNPDACWQWIVFLSEQVPCSLIPARRSLVESTVYDQLVGNDIAAVARASLTSALPVYHKFYQISDIFDDAATTIVDGDSTPQEAMDKAQREAVSRMAAR